jgi:hypothetical protein
MLVIPSMRTTGSMIGGGRSGRGGQFRSVGRQSSAVGTGCCTLVLHASSLALKRQPEAHGSGGGNREASAPAGIVIESGSGPRLVRNPVINYRPEAYGQSPLAS